MRKLIDERNYQYKARWIAMFMSFCIIFVVLAGLCLQVYSNNDFLKPSNWFNASNVSDDSSDESLCASAVIDNSVIKLTTSTTSTSSSDVWDLSGNLNYSDYITITATISPSNAFFKTLNWKATFKSNNRDASSYVTLKVSDDTLTCKVNRQSRFSSSILVTAYSTRNSAVKASVQLDCVARLNGISSSNNTLKFGELNEFDLNFEYLTGSVYGTIEFNDRVDIKNISGNTNWFMLYDTHFSKDYNGFGYGKMCYLYLRSLYFDFTDRYYSYLDGDYAVSEDDDTGEYEYESLDMEQIYEYLNTYYITCDIVLTCTYTYNGHSVYRGNSMNSTLTLALKNIHLDASNFA